MQKSKFPRRLAVAAMATLTFGVVCVSNSIALAGEKIVQPTAVVEMFTSQGCSSCPPADKVLARYAANKNVLALSWHVDYWNYLGWKDSFSRADFTERQYRYAASFKRRGVYTPQAVINGRDHLVGSHAGKIKDLIAAYSSQKQNLTIPITVAVSDDKVRVSASDAGNVGDATLWIVYFDHEKAVKIKRGENRGRTITYHNVVRDFSTLGMAKDGKIDVTLPLNELKRKGSAACAVILQQVTKSGTPGPILGATIIDELQAG